MSRRLVIYTDDGRGLAATLLLRLPKLWTEYHHVGALLRSKVAFWYEIRHRILGQMQFRPFLVFLYALLRNEHNIFSQRDLVHRIKPRVRRLLSSSFIPTSPTTPSCPIHPKTNRASLTPLRNRHLAILVCQSDINFAQN